MRKRATVKTYNMIIVFVALLFCAAMGKMAYVVLNDEVDGINLKEKSESITTASKTLYASRGTIYDINGDNFATTVNSYTLVAYLSPARTTNDKKPQHVVDKAYTAKQLATVLDMSEEDILKYLNKDVYQTYFGTKGTGLSELTKKEIEKLELPGIDFVSSAKRFYNKANTASYIVGYAKTDEETGEIEGYLGIEGYYNDVLSGTNGYTTYQKYTASNYQIPNTPSQTEPAENGSDIYLTIDNKIQLLAEKAAESYSESGVEWAVVTVMDAKTGAIVASATSPTFDPNDTNTIESYLNPLVSTQYEPGSVMKIFSWASIIEENKYNGSETYKSGSIPVADGVINDSNKKGWGEITFDKGFAYSSNVAAATLALRLGTEKLRGYYDKLGFGHKTGIELSNEVNGSVKFKYPMELANAAFGQGLSVTPIQMLQALSSMTNDGNIIKPYIVDKIVDSKGNITYQGQRTVVNNVYSSKTVEKMHELMHNVIYGGATSVWRVENVNLMGKTGTAQIASPKGGYLTGNYDYVKSFAGIFPADDPKYIVYIAAKHMHVSGRDFYPPATTLIEDLANYAKLTENVEVNESKLIDVSNYISKEANATVALLENKNIDLVVIGNGKYIINQYPLKNSTIFVGGKLFLLTNGKEVKMPNMVGWSRNDAQTYCNLANIKCEFDKHGSVITQSVEEGTVLNSDTVIKFELALE